MMKRCALSVVLAISICASVSAQNFDLKYYSSTSDGDYKNDYGGVAVALYLTDPELRSPVKKATRFGNRKPLPHGRSPLNHWIA